MNIQNVGYAFHATFEHFDDIWANPNITEKEFFYEFLIMQSFITLQWSPELLAEFWTLQNDRLIANHGFDKYDELVARRAERFLEYRSVYEALSETDCFQDGSAPKSDSEFSAIQAFCGLVFNYVEIGYISPFEAQIHLQLGERCLSVIALHMAHIYEQ